MLDHAQLATLAAVLRLGSFDGAAARLGITQSAVSQRIRALEVQVGQPLVLRGSPCTGTETGLRLARHAEDVALMEARALADIGADQPGPVTLRLAVNADSLAAWLIPALSQAEAAQPGLLFDVVVDDQDHSADWLRRGAVMAAITGTATPPHGCDAIPLGSIRYFATACPAWIARHCPDGVTGPALRAAPCLTYDLKDRLQAIWLQRHFGEGPPPPTHYIPSTEGFIDAASAGLGWGMNPEPMLRDAFATGRLVPLLPDAHLDTPLYWQVSRRMAPALAPVTAAIRAEAARVLHPAERHEAR
ncbi:LysR family transcriptional regulator [Oceanicola sp. 22II-s10i]|uniref:LysR family transcriptional regulator ArgP n=1 Tax=Oceanicola sp. 22II-s10i TaxID=1317116 RepID=UPI000B51E854|nr:LysR family transcriptional regulator ArgP [Oceanicola sp. 22II-s10i]OWU85151.1 LysR family transcriptional regulator [Oceanicola sp. 22II-s10i]